MQDAATAPDGSVLILTSASVPGGGLEFTVSRAEGSEWAPVTDAQPAFPSRLGVGPNGEIVVTASQDGEGSIVYAWEDGAWVAVGEPFELDPTTPLTFDASGGVIIAGRPVGEAWGVHRWTGSVWERVGAGFDRGGDGLAAGPDGSLYAAGRFEPDGPRGVLRWDGTAWQALGGELGAVRRIELGPAGELYAVAPSQDGPGDGVRRWTGDEWEWLGGGPTDGSILDLSVGDDGRVLAVGAFVTRGPQALVFAGEWDGTEWQSYGSGLSNGTSARARVSAISIAPDGAVVVGGTFRTAGAVAASNIARRTGAGWEPLGDGLLTLDMLTHASGGAVFAFGSRRLPSGGVLRDVYRWDGSAWASDGPPRRDVRAGPGRRGPGRSRHRPARTTSSPSRATTAACGCRWATPSPRSSRRSPCHREAVSTPLEPSTRRAAAPVQRSLSGTARTGSRSAP